MKSLDAVDDCGLVPLDKNACASNTARLASCMSNDTVVSIANTVIYLYPGVQFSNLHNVVLNVTGELRFLRPPHALPRDPEDPFSNHVLSCLAIANSTNITLKGTRSQRGLFHGGGPAWWGIPFLGYWRNLERRPKLLQITRSSHIQVAHLNFQDAPMYTLYMNGVIDVQIHDISIVNRRRSSVDHDWLDMSAFNTDGIDIAGHEIHIANVDIVTQDDCIAVKDNYMGDGVSRNILVERVNATGLGFVVGSLGGSTVQDVVVRDSLLYHTWKGIYLKARDYNLVSGSDTILRNISFQNIEMIRPQQWAIWMGPAQQMSGTNLNPCAAKPCSLCWPTVPGAVCLPPKHPTLMDTVSLTNVTIVNPVKSLGVLLGSDESPIRNVLFDSVRTEFRSTAEVDLKETFPGTILPVDDPYLRRGLVLVLFVAVLVTCLLVLCCRKCRNRSRQPTFSLIPDDVDDDEENMDPLGEATNLDNGEVSGGSLAEHLTTSSNASGDSTNHLIATGFFQSRWFLVRCCLLAMALSFLFLFVWTYRMRSRLLDVNQYLVCAGVTNGVATGNTFPVPSCFRDETVPR